MSLLNLFRYAKIPRKEITIESIRSFMADESTKRIHFSTHHIGALVRSNDGPGGKIKLPFSDSIKPIIKEALDLDLYESKYGNGVYWKRISSEEEFDKFQRFINIYNDIVFLRDNLDLSLALSMNFKEEERTKIGKLEYIAKYPEGKTVEDVQTAENDLAKTCKDWFEELPFYKYADYICSMPCSNPEIGSLPKRIISSLRGFEFTDISNYVRWSSKKRKIKDAASVDEKVIILEESGLTISKGIDLKNKTVVLFDDLYMSGISMQYVAMKLKEAGARRVFGLCIVKSRNNTTR